MPPYNNGIGYFIYVGDISEVYRYYVPKGTSMFFMAKEQPVLYIKAVDNFGQVSIKTYDLTERVTEPISPPPMPIPQTQSQYVTRDELTGVIQETIRTELRNNRNRNTRKEEN